MMRCGFPSPAWRQPSTPRTAGVCKVYDDAGGLLRRVDYDTRRYLLEGNLADAVGDTDHVRLKIGVDWVARPDALHGLDAVELSRRYRGDQETRRDAIRMDRAGR